MILVAIAAIHSILRAAKFHNYSPAYNCRPSSCIIDIDRYPATVLHDINQAAVPPGKSACA